MKLLLHIFLLFLGFNSFSQDLIPATIKNENDTLKIVSVKGKVGVVHKNGRQILEPNYTDVKIEPLGIRFYDGELQGYLPAGKQTAIPANYKEIVQVYGYFEGKTENGTVDLYYGSERIAESLDTAPLEVDVLPESGLIVIRKEDKAGIIDQKGVIIVPLEYSTVERIQSFTYRLTDQTDVDYILSLDKAEYFYSPESDGFYRFGEPELSILKADGTFISDSVFTEVSAVNPEKKEISLKTSKRQAFLDQQFNITYSPYEEVVEFLEWKFCSTGKNVLILNRYNLVIDSFADVMIPYELPQTFNEEELEAAYYNQIRYEDFVYVMNTVEGNNLTAIYDLKNQKVVSDFQKSVTFVRKGINPSGSVVWIYKDETDMMAFGLSTTGKSSGFEYEDIYQVSRQFYAFKKPGETNYRLCELIDDWGIPGASGGIQPVFAERMIIEKSFGSLNYAGLNTPGVLEYDPELYKGFVDDFGNYSSFSGGEQTGIVSPFTAPFTLIRNQNGKLGFISWNGKVIDLDADTLFPNSNASRLIEYRSGNLWGAADLIWGSVFKADQAESGHFSILEDLGLIYRLNETETHYVDDQGRVFYSTNPERSIAKKGKWKGANLYSEFDDKIEVAIPFVYREILHTWNERDCLAQNSAKKWGILTPFNDTLFPFNYDQLSFDLGRSGGYHEVFPYTDYDEICYTTSGNFHGILSLNKRKEIPPVYEQVNYVPNAAFIVRKNGKSGVYDYLLNEKIKPVFDEVFIASSKEGVYILRAKRDNKWFAMEFFEGKIPDQTAFEQVPGFDLVINETGFVKTASGYEARDFNNVVIQKEAMMSEYLDENQFKLVDGKIFLLDLKGKLLYPDALTNIVILEDGRVISSENGTAYSYATWAKKKEVFTE